MHPADRTRWCFAGARHRRARLTGCEFARAQPRGPTCMASDETRVVCRRRVYTHHAHGVTPVVLSTGRDGDAPVLATAARALSSRVCAGAAARPTMHRVRQDALCVTLLVDTMRMATRPVSRRPGRDGDALAVAEDERGSLVASLRERSREAEHAWRPTRCSNSPRSHASSTPCRQHHMRALGHGCDGVPGRLPARANYMGSRTVDARCEALAACGCIPATAQDRTLSTRRAGSITCASWVMDVSACAVASTRAQTTWAVRS